jgi:hypothetical protein
MREGVSSWLGWFFDRFSSILPNFSSYWTEAWVQAPTCFLGGVISLIAFYIWSAWVKNNIQEVAETGWWHFKDHGSQPPNIKPGIFEKAATWMRSREESRRIYSFLKHIALPVGFSAIVAIIAIGAVYRVFLHYPAIKDGACVFLEEKDQSSGKGMAEAGDEGADLNVEGARDFSTTDPCFPTGMTLEKGQHYEISVFTFPEEMPKGRDEPGEIAKIIIDISQGMTWRDLDMPAGTDGLDGFWQIFNPILVFATPARRHLSLPWFTLMGEIGKDSGHVFPINQDDPFVFIAPAKGELHLYVNDMINAPGFGVRQGEEDTNGEIIKSYDPDAAYQNNEGKAKVTLVPAREAS